MRVKTVVAVLALAMCGAFAPPDETAMTNDMAERFRKSVPDAKFEVTGPLTIEASDIQGEGGQINLDRVYKFCADNAADDCEQMKRDFVEGMTESLAASDAVATRDRLRLAVRPRDYCDDMLKLTTDKGMPSIFTEPYAEGLCTIMTVDAPRSLRFAHIDDLKALGLARDAAWALARAQVIESLPAVTSRPTVIADIDYAPSLMLADAQWSALAKAEGEAPLVAVPSDTLLVVLRKDVSNEEIARTRALIAEEQRRAARPVSPLIYRWSPTGWAVER